MFATAIGDELTEQGDQHITESTEWSDIDVQVLGMDDHVLGNGHFSCWGDQQEMAQAQPEGNKNPKVLSEYILAPESRTVYPVKIHTINGNITNAESLLGNSSGNAVFLGLSSVTFDYSKAISGIVSLTIGSSSSTNAFISLTYSESSDWISSQASDGSMLSGLDEPLLLHVGNGPGVYTVESFHNRGSFRYLTLTSNTTATIEITGVSANFTAAPNQKLRDYTGFFHCSDEKLNRVWYAGAYTNQLCSIDPNTGNADFHADFLAGDLTEPTIHDWYANTTIANGSSALVDGAKRDRIVWPGDMAVSLESIFVSTNDLTSVKNSIDSLFNLQNTTTGLLPYAGYPFSEIGVVSFTYHLYTLIGLSYFYHVTGDIAHLQSHWWRFKLGLQWSLDHVDSSGLMNVTASADWLRVGMGAHNIEANALLYHTLTQGLSLAAILNDSTVISTWTNYSSHIKTAANSLLWDEEAGLYRDNETTTLHPQDGNAWAVKANLTTSPEQIATISAALQARWGPFGAPAPEAGPTTTISPFISAFELEAHFLASAPNTALPLIRLQWADFMLDDPRLTNSTFTEGYSANGSLGYFAYESPATVSQAHGWSTGPTSLLSFYVAGLHLAGAQGREWRIAPMMADLTYVHAGFETPLGSFENEVSSDRVNGTISMMSFKTPVGTKGSVVLKGVRGYLLGSDGVMVGLVDGEARDVWGGNWTLVARD